MQDIIKTDRVNNLLDLYSELLTDKQKEVMDMYYIYDLSLKEISEDLEVSRNAVFDLLKRTNQILENYESKLHLLEKRKNVLEIIKDLDSEIKDKIEKNI